MSEPSEEYPLLTEAEKSYYIEQIWRAMGLPDEFYIFDRDKRETVCKDETSSDG